MMKSYPLYLCSLSLVLLSACGGNTVKETFGIDQRAPDEFRVVSRPPLSVPPQFDLLPPGEGRSPTVVPARNKAETLILGTKEKPKVTAGKTTADKLFLEKAGTSQADPAIKKQLTEEKIRKQTTREEEGWWDAITTLPGNKEPVVKAEEEAERIKKNKEEGNPITEGETPETGGGPVSVLQRWMGYD